MEQPLQSGVAQGHSKKKEWPLVECILQNVHPPGYRGHNCIITRKRRILTKTSVGISKTLQQYSINQGGLGEKQKAKQDTMKTTSFDSRAKQSTPPAQWFLPGTPRIANRTCLSVGEPTSFENVLPQGRCAYSEEYQIPSSSPATTDRRSSGVRAMSPIESPAENVRNTRRMGNDR